MKYLKYALVFLAAQVFSAAEQEFRLPPGVELCGTVQPNPEAPGTWKLTAGSALCSKIGDLYFTAEPWSPGFGGFCKLQASLRTRYGLKLLFEQILGRLLNHDPEVDPLIPSQTIAELNLAFYRANTGIADLDFGYSLTKDKVLADAERQKKAEHEYKQEFAETWDRLGIGLVSDDPFRLGNSNFTDPFDYFAQYLTRKGLAKCETYAKMSAFLRSDGASCGSPGYCIMNQLEYYGYTASNWGELQKILPGLMRCVADPKRNRAMCSYASVESYPYAVYATTDPDFSFAPILETGAHASLLAFIENYQAVRCFVTLDTDCSIEIDGKVKAGQLEQRGINRVPSLTEDQTGPLAITLTKFAAIVGHTLNPNSELLAMGTLPSMTYRIITQMPEGTYVTGVRNLSNYYGAGDMSFALNVGLLSELLYKEMNTAKAPEANT